MLFETGVHCMVKVAINGFGRIGRNVLRAAYTKGIFGKKFDLVAINDLTDSKMLAYLLRYDSIHGRFSGEVSSKEGKLVVDGIEIPITTEKDPASLPWKKLGVDVVIESTGFFTEVAKAQAHITAGARKVAISAPSKDAACNIVIGVNEETYDTGTDHVVSMASCTTNCLAPMAKVLEESFGIERGFVNTIHAYTNDQKIHDQPHKDYRRGRAAALSIVPTSTGAAKAIGSVIPSLKGKLDGLALRVPIPDGSITDLTCVLGKAATKEEINGTFKKAAAARMKNILEYNEDELVSADVVGNPHSCVFDSKLTYVNGNVVKVMGWYDNEWGYSNRLVELATKIL